MASGDLDASEPEEDFTLGTDEPADELTVPTDEDEPEPAAITSLTTADEEENAADEEAIDVAESREKAPRRASPRRDRPRRAAAKKERSHLGPIFIFLGLVVIGYALLARALFASPALCDKLVSRLPLISAVGDDRLLVRKIALSEVRGNYQRIKDGKEVFVITGTALNTATVPLHGVQIEGKMYDNSGGALDEKTISCGNVISAKVLKDLTPQEVSILQKLSPPKRFTIEPGGSSSFVIVFMDPPHHAVEFSARVAGAQRQA